MIYVVIGRETITDISASIGFTSTELTSAVIYAVVQAIDQAVRFCIDGTTPETAVGMRLTVNDSVEVWGTAALAAFRAIEETATGKLEAIYMGRGS